MLNIKMVCPYCHRDCGPDACEDHKALALEVAETGVSEKVSNWECYECSRGWYYIFKVGVKCVTSKHRPAISQEALKQLEDM